MAMPKPKFGKWLPIESAPQDNPVLIVADRQILIGYWLPAPTQGLGKMLVDIDNAPIHDATHWMPLPKLPNFIERSGDL